MMSYRISFDGPASADLQQVLHALERQLHWHDIHAQTPADTAASVAAASAVRPCPKGEVCPDNTHGGHEPAVVVIAIVALVVGMVIGYIIGKGSRSTSINR
ncbi:MAG: hypothetical protein ACLQO1_12325 [Steroidobacteraceae bacterium]